MLATILLKATETSEYAQRQEETALETERMFDELISQFDPGATE
jgi:hypothetical protein